jgi:hypothetical protein
VVEQLSDLPDGVLGFRASGKITREEYDEMMKPIYAALERGEKLNIYFELAEDFHGLDGGAFWEDLKAAASVGLKHRSSWQKTALITDKDWIRRGLPSSAQLRPGSCASSSPMRPPRHEPGSPPTRPAAPSGRWPRTSMTQSCRSRRR